MQCPLCGGPLHVERPEQFACERGHRLEGTQLAQTAAGGVTMAFWMAIEASDSETGALRLLAHGAGRDDELAERAAADAQVLRGLAGAHLAPLGGTGDRC